MIIPAMAIAGSLAAKKSVPAIGRHVPDHRRPVRRPGGRRDPDRRRPHLLPGAGARPHRRASRDDRRHAVLRELIGASSMETSQIRKRRTPVSALLDPEDRRPGDRLGLRQARSPTLMKNPVMFVLEIVTVLTTIIFLRDLFDRRRAPRLRASRSSSGCGSPCCSPISPRRSPRAAARRRPTRCAGSAPRRRPSC